MTSKIAMPVGFDRVQQPLFRAARYLTDVFNERVVPRGHILGRKRLLTFQPEPFSKHILHCAYPAFMTRLNKAPTSSLALRLKTVLDHLERRLLLRFRAQLDKFCSLVKELRA